MNDPDFYLLENNRVSLPTIEELITKIFLQVVNDVSCMRIHVLHQKIFLQAKIIFCTDEIIGTK